MKTKIICTYNNKEIFDFALNNNQSLNECDILSFDNTTENISITKRYNTFIKENILNNTSDKEKEEEGFWCIFIHQDFGFLDSPDLLLKNADKNNIYGAVGVKILKGIFFGKKPVENKLGFKTELKLTFGRILQGNNDKNFKKHGRSAIFKPTVETTDCCCVIMHSSLIKKYGILFDENLEFHMYAEELCYRAKKDYNIKTKILPFKCFHMGKGLLNEAFYESAEYLKKKFNIKRVPSTCPN